MKGRTATLDHFLPREKGGGNESSNLLTACFKCNSSRRDSPALLFASIEGLERAFAALDMLC